nr:hypothetical protein [Tanacetum cinerariifolium]
MLAKSNFQKFLYKVDELRAISGHMLGASGVQIPENNLDNLHSIIKDGTLEIMDPQELLGLVVLLSIGIGFLRRTIVVVVILVIGHTFPTNVKVRPVGCDPLALESKFTLVEESTGVLETTFVEDVVLTGVFPDEGICSVNLIFLLLFFGVIAISLVPKLLMQGQRLLSATITLIFKAKDPHFRTTSGYNAIPPPAVDLYLSPKKDLSWTGLPEFVDDTVNHYSRPSPTIESTSEDSQNQNSSAFENGEPTDSILSKHAVKFVKAVDRQAERPTINKAETLKKPIVKYAEILVGHRPHGAPMRPPHRLHGPSMKPMRPNMNGARPNRTTFNKQAHSYANRSFQRTSVVRPQYRAPWVPTVNGNFPPVNRKLPTGNLNVSTVCCCCSRHVNSARPKAVINRRNKVKDVQAVACWVWKPVKPNSASIILKRYDYVEFKRQIQVCDG